MRNIRVLCSKAIASALAVCLLSVSSLLSGCATDYKGRTPDFTKTGAEAVKEVNDFTFHEAPFIHNAAQVMGSEKKAYWHRSLRPVYEAVSPEATVHFKKARHAGIAMNVLTAGILAYSFFISEHQSDSGNNIAYWSFIGAALGGGFYVTHQVGKGREAYNADLRKRFAPVVSYQLNY